MRMWVQSLALLRVLSCSVGHRRGWDPVLLWLWRRLAAVALIRPRFLAWDPSYVSGTALKSKKKKIPGLKINIARGLKIKINHKLTMAELKNYEFKK